MFNFWLISMVATNRKEDGEREAFQVIFDTFLYLNFCICKAKFTSFS